MRAVAASAWAPGPGTTDYELCDEPELCDPPSSSVEEGAESPRGQLERWRAEGRVVWLELAIPEDREGWFEGAVGPWTRLQTPHIDWTTVNPTFKALGVADKISEADQNLDRDAKLLALLPHVYALGVARVRGELVDSAEQRGTRWSRKCRRAEPTAGLCFPTVGFEPDDGTPDERPASFWTIRTNVAVVGQIVVTIRLPDLLCSGADGEVVTRTPVGAPMRVPRRYLPGRFSEVVRHKLTPEDVAEGIFVHHAATARSVAERTRMALRRVEREVDVLSLGGGRPAGAPRLRAQEALNEVARMHEIVQQIDRQLSRELRRLAEYGEATHPVVGHAIQRYEFAVHEIESLGSELTTAKDSITSAVQAREQADREKFQFITALIGSAILFPTLIAAIYGANVALPGKGTWTGFAALMLFILSFAVLGLLAVNVLWARGWEPRERAFGWRMRILTAAVATAALTMGVIAAVTPDHNSTAAKGPVKKATPKVPPARSQP